MARSSMPDTYIGREQAYIKHTILNICLGDASWTWSYFGNT